ncbi:hypothetical protein Tco_1284268 [Tanacetum coccineum]
MDHQTSSILQIAYHSPQVSTQPMTEFPQLDSGLAIPVFTQGDDPIACLNKAMSFMSAVVASRVTVQQVQGRQGQSYVGTGYKGNATSFGGNNDQEMLAKALESDQILDQEQLAFLADPGILYGQVVEITIPNNAAFQTEDLDAYDSDCDDVSNAKAVLMANLSNYGSDVILEVPHFECYHYDMDNQSVHAMQDFEQTPVVDFSDNEITSDSNIISYSQYLQETQQAAIQDTNLYEQQDSMILSKAQRIKPTLYDGSVISSQHVVIPMIDDEETLILKELNRLSEDFGKHFVPQQELFAEQAFWLQTSHPNTDQFDISPVIIESPRELPKVSMVNTSLKKLKYHLGKFDTMVKKRITPDAITEGEWGFEHTKVVFLNEIIPFLKTIKDIFNVFDRDLLNEVMEVQTVFNQMEAAVQQCSVDK